MSRLQHGPLITFFFFFWGAKSNVLRVTDSHDVFFPSPERRRSGRERKKKAWSNRWPAAKQTHLSWMALQPPLPSSTRPYELVCNTVNPCRSTTATGNTKLRYKVSTQRGRGDTKRTDPADSVTLIAAEEDSDIISRQLLSVSFHFSVVLSSPPASLSYIKPHSSSSSNKTARRLIVGEVFHVARFLSCFLFFSFFLAAAWLHSATVAVKTSFVCVCFPFTCRQRAG